MPEIDLSSLSETQLINELLGRPTFAGIIVAIDQQADPSRGDVFDTLPSAGLKRRRASHLLHRAADVLDRG